MNLGYGGFWPFTNNCSPPPPPPPSITSTRTKIMNLNMMEPLNELDPGGGFEPQTRARSNTWPLPRPENYVEPSAGGGGEEGGGGGGAASSGNKCPQTPASVSAAAAAAAAAAKKSSSRRNAWGNLSYADLITQAITSSPDKRLTLSQIYEWMVQNVPYFKDKGDSNSSAGWKNSIRHNLSLHNRFMRVQNEGTGKSSWWMINPDAKPGKAVRRRAASMETSKFEKRRGRVKKKVELMRNGGALPDTTPSPTSSISESVDLFPDSPIHSSGGFQLSPDFRPRASSNTSSCGGRLSPIPAVVGPEPDWGSPMTTATSYSGNTEMAPPPPNNGAGGSSSTGYSPADQLAGNLEQGMKLQTDAYTMGYMNGQTPQQPPPPYTAPYEQFPVRREINSLHATSPYGLSQCPIHRIHTCSCLQTCKVERMSPTGMSPSYPHSDPSPPPILNSQFLTNARNNPMPRPPSTSPPLADETGSGTNGQGPGQNQGGGGGGVQQQQGPAPSTMMGQLMGALNSSSSTVLDDLNINVESFQGGFDCNVEELIKHELSMEGSLDFNFPHQLQQHHHHHHLHNHHHQQPNLVGILGATQPDSLGSSNNNNNNNNNSQSGAGAAASAAPPPQPPPAYSTTVTAPSWVH